MYSGPKGLTVVLRSGLLAYFGDATRPHAKWIALTRVLADPSSAGVAYIDVRLPERPAAGFAPGTARPEASSTETESSGGSDPATTAELAAGLDAAVGGGSSSSTGSSGSSSADEPAPSGSTSSSSSPWRNELRRGLERIRSNERVALGTGRLRGRRNARWSISDRQPSARGLSGHSKPNPRLEVDTLR